MVMAVVDQLFAGMKLKSAEQLKGVFTPEAQFIAIDKPLDGKGISTSRVTTGEAFVNAEITQLVDPRDPFAWGIPVGKP